MPRPSSNPAKDLASLNALVRNESSGFFNRIVGTGQRAAMAAAGELQSGGGGGG